MMASANLINGVLADYVNAPLMLIVGGISFIGIMALSWQYMTLRNIYTRGIVHEAHAAAD